MKAEIHFKLDDDLTPSGIAEGKMIDLVALLLAFASSGEDESSVLLLAAGTYLHDQNDIHSVEASCALQKVMRARISQRSKG